MWRSGGFEMDQLLIQGGVLSGTDLEGMLKMVS